MRNTIFLVAALSLATLATGTVIGWELTGLAVVGGLVGGLIVNVIVNLIGGTK